MSSGEAIEERRACAGCVDDRALLQRMSGANTVRNWLIGVLVLSVLGSGVFARADNTQIALNAEAIRLLLEDSKQNKLDHKEMADSREEQTKILLDAINKAK